MWYKESIYNLKHHLSTVKRNNFRLSVSVIKRYGNPKGHSRMDNQRHRQHWEHKKQDEDKQSNNKKTQHAKLKRRATRTSSKIRISFPRKNKYSKKSRK